MTISIINQYTANSATLNEIFNKADSSDNKNGKIDTAKERNLVKKLAEQCKEKLQKEGVTLKRCNEQVGTSVDFKRGESLFNLKFNKRGDVETMSDYNNEGKHEEIAKFFGLEKSALSKVANYFETRETEYEDKNGSTFAPWGAHKLWNKDFIPGKPHSN